MVRSLAIACLAIALATAPSLAKDGNNGNGQENGNNGKDNGNNGNHYGEDNGNSQGNASNPPPSSPASSSSPPTPSSTPSSASPSSPSSAAGAAPPTSTTSDQDMALDAVQDARALPLETIANKVHLTTPGNIIDARLMTVNGFLLYEVKVLDGNRLDVLYYYAQTGNKVGG